MSRLNKTQMYLALFSLLQEFSNSLILDLFYYSLFEVLCEVGTDFHGGVFGGDFGHVGLDHEFD